MIFHSKSQSVPIFSEETIRGMIHPRGPDCFTSQTFESVTLGTIQMYGALLSLRGLPTPIPYETLLWNGEVFGGSVTVPVDENDTVHVLEHLRSTDESDIVAAMSAIEGPYAFCYYDSRSNCLWFGRDPMGRRSLLCCLTDNTLVLSSVALDAAQVSSGQQTKSAFFELPVDSLFSLRPNADESTLVLSAHRRDVHIPALRSAELPFKQAFGAKLRDSVRRRVVNIPLPPLSAACGDNICRLAVLFSGGIDCTILAYLCDAFVPSGEVIDLLNVSFAEQDYDSAPDRQTALQSLQELQSRCPERRFRLIRVNVSAVAFAAHTKRIFELILPRNSLLDFNLASALYFASRGHGVDADGQPVSTSARVLISGLGSDELLAGYGYVTSLR
jgi:asparagine synthetase B (glutamine-hydrolysing)